MDPRNTSREFARSIVAAIQGGWTIPPPGANYQPITLALESHLTDFLAKKGLGPGRVDYEGAKRKRGSQVHSYPLLGTWTHPDAAVLEPFRCAFEFDLEKSTSSPFKTALLKAAAHALCGRYDSVVFLYFLKSSNPQAPYFSDNSSPAGPSSDSSVSNTRTLLTHLEENGVFVALVPNLDPPRSSASTT